MGAFFPHFPAPLPNKSMEYNNLFSCIKSLPHPHKHTFFPHTQNPLLKARRIFSTKQIALPLLTKSPRNPSFPLPPQRHRYPAPPPNKSMEYNNLFPCIKGQFSPIPTPSIVGFSAVVPCIKGQFLPIPTPFIVGFSAVVSCIKGQFSPIPTPYSRPSFPRALPCTGGPFPPRYFGMQYLS